MWAIGILIVAVVALGVLAARGRLGQLAPELPDRPGPDLPDGPLGAKDLHELTFAVVTRGYEMSQVDAVLARLAAQLEDSQASSRPSSRSLSQASAEEDGAAAPRDWGDNGVIGVGDGVNDEKRGSNGSNEAPNR